MNAIQDLVNNLDFLVENGRFNEAISRFFADSVITEGASGAKTLNKAEKISTIASFIDSLGSTEYIKFHDNVVFDNKTISKFTFIFKANGKLVKWHELIERHWEADKVIYEYYTQGSLSDLKKAIKIAKKRMKIEQEKSSTVIQEKPVKVKVNKAVQKEIAAEFKEDKPIGRPKKSSKTNASPKTPASSNKTSKAGKVASGAKSTGTSSDPKKTSSKTSEVSKVKDQSTSTDIKPRRGRPRKDAKVFETKAPQQKTAAKNKISHTPKTTAKKSVGRPRKVVKIAPNDFKVIQGIGPKIEQFLKESGIDTYEKLAVANVEHMAAILLEKGGSRYNANSPATWPAQAQILVKSGLDELKNWQLAN